jgi:hypothetical protein
MALRVIWQYMVRHQSNSIWTEASEVHIILQLKWETTKLLQNITCRSANEMK